MKANLKNPLKTMIMNKWQMREKNCSKKECSWLKICCKMYNKPISTWIKFKKKFTTRE